MVEFEMGTPEAAVKVEQAVLRYARDRGLGYDEAMGELVKRGLEMIAARQAKKNRKEKNHGKEEVERNPRNRRAAQAVSHRGGRREGSRDGRARRVRGQRCEA